MSGIDIEQEVHNFYWVDDYNCAATTLLILSKGFNIELSTQLIDAATGMHGAGKYGAQCGLVEGSLMFIGIMGKALGFDNEIIANICNKFAGEFEKAFLNLNCSVLRPGGFNDDDPQHLCEELTVDAIEWVIDFINEAVSKIKL